MPPHCDSLDGPVVAAAREALERNDVTVVLPYVHAPGEDEVRSAFARTQSVRTVGGPAQELAERWFFETVVRVHRAGEGAAFTGLKPAGLDVGPVIPVAERAADDLRPDALAELLAEEVRRQIRDRIDRLRSLDDARSGDVPSERRYVEARLGLQVYSHRLFRQMQAE